MVRHPSLNLRNPSLTCESLYEPNSKHSNPAAEKETARRPVGSEFANHRQLGGTEGDSVSGDESKNASV